MSASRFVLVLLPVGLLACADPPAFCAGATAFAYDPAAPGAELAAFPDDFYTAPDPASRTGLAVKVDETNAPWLQDLPPIQAGIYAELKHLDGFGTTAGITLRFTGKLGTVPTGERESLDSQAIRLVELGADGAVRVPFETQVTDDGAAIILWPMRPLRPKTRHAVVVTTKQADAAGHCIAPGPNLQALLSGEKVPAALAALSARYQALLKTLGLAAQDVSAATVFTTQSIEEETVAVATDIRARTYAWKERPTCTAVRGAPYKACRGVFTAQEYRKEGVVVDGTPQATYDVPVGLWLPTTGGPWPVLLYGHGLGGTRDQAEFVADIAAPLGVATVAIDAPNHGEHPTAQPGATQNPAAAVLDFFAADVAEGTIHPLVLRDHWREATYDKLQVLKLLRDVPDLDGDGTADLESGRTAYYGLSLGGIMGSELLANADLGLAMLTVPGGRVASIVSDAANFQLVVELLRPAGTDPGSTDRFFPVLQATLEKGDGANWAPHVLRDRLPSAGQTPPHLLFEEVIGDDTVPNVCNHALARALGLPQMPVVVKEVGLIPVLDAGPVRGNLPGGLTAALFQFDRVTFRAGRAPVPAAHNNIAGNRENVEQTRHFLQTWLAGGAPEIVDPYVTLQTPPLAR